MAAEEAGPLGRVPACLCVLCGIPAAGKTTLSAEVLSTAAQHGWRASVVPYDDLIPEQAFQTRGVEDGAKMEEMVKTFDLTWLLLSIDYVGNKNNCIVSNNKVLYLYNVIFKNMKNVMMQERNRNTFETCLKLVI